MTMKIAVFCVMLALHSSAALTEFPCEKINDYSWDMPIGKQRTCFMNKNTAIDSSDVSISSTADASIGAINFYGNKKIKFLPKNPAEKFANLMVYDARYCDIESISYHHFKGLTKLQKLHLSSNKIKKVTSDTFKDLISLKTLWLEHNQIKFMNGATFHRLDMLIDVDVDYNICIDGRYQSASSVLSLTRALNYNCAFNEDEEEEITTMSSNYVSENETKLKSCRLENADMLSKISQIENQLKVAKHQFEELHQKSELSKHENMILTAEVERLTSKS